MEIYKFAPKSQTHAPKFFPPFLFIWAYKLASLHSVQVTQRTQPVRLFTIQQACQPTQLICALALQPVSLVAGTPTKRLIFRDTISSGHHGPTSEQARQRGESDSCR